MSHIGKHSLVCVHGYEEGKDCEICYEDWMTKNDSPQTLKDVYNLMKFGCPWKKEGIGEQDVARFERRMDKGADIL